MAEDVAEAVVMNKPRRPQTRPLADLLRKTLSDAFAKQGFASTELVTRWSEIVGAEIATYSEPEKIRWARPVGNDLPEPGTLVLRVEGPMALEIQHMSGVVLERVNRFFGWQAIGDIRLRQAPLSRRKRSLPPPIDPEAQARIADSLTDIADSGLRDALARLGAAVKSR
jgi:hypothetical protein